MTIRTFIGAILILGVVQAPAAADISWEQTDTVVEDGESMIITQKVFITDDRFAIESSGGMKIIITLADGMVTVIDASQRIYTTMSLESIGDMQKSVHAETSAIIEEALKNVPESERATYRAMIEEQMNKQTTAEDVAPAPDWGSAAPTGKTRTLLGREARQYILATDDGTTELWCTTAIDIGEMNSFMEKIRATGFLADYAQALPTFSLGFPLLTIDKTGDSTSTSEVTSVSTSPLDKSVFAIPAGFIQNSPGMPATSRP